MKQTTTAGFSARAVVAAAAALMTTAVLSATNARAQQPPAPRAGQTTTTTTRSQNGGTTTTTVTTRPNRTGGTTTITVTVNRKPVAFPEAGQPRMIDGHVMVPLRGVIEELGGNVLYDPATQVITGAQPQAGKQFRIRIGSDQALVNGQNTSLDAFPRVFAGTTYVPLRFVSEALGASVNWDDATRTVVISAAGNDATLAAPRN